MNDENIYSDNDFENNQVYFFEPKDLEVIMGRLQGVSEFFSYCQVDDLMQMWQKFQKLNEDGMYSMSLDIVSKFTDFLVNDSINELIAKDLIDYQWSDEHNDFVFTTKDSSGV